MKNYTLADLGWSAHFDAQVGGSPRAQTVAMRIGSVARDRLVAISGEGAQSVLPPSHMTTGAFAVGDWVLVDPSKMQVVHRLTPKTELARRSAGTGADRQLIAANVDTLGIVTSCNADFNEARLERYLALAAAAGCLPLVLLTKADLSDDPASFARRAERLSPLVTCLSLDATDPEAVDGIAPWCRDGETLALVGSSGVGKSTLANSLTGQLAATAAIREDDSKGRHTTTARGLYRTRFGGWLIDTPGMRALRLSDAEDGVAAVFEDLASLARECRFSDCTHTTEPGCAIRAAIAGGALDPDRLDRWTKLQREDRRNSETLAQSRRRDRAFGKMVKNAMKHKRR